MPGIYQLSTPQRLFEKLRRDWAAFYHHPTEDGLFNLLFPIYHLREWIFPDGYQAYDNKPQQSYSPEELLHSSLHSLHAYKVVKALCNNAKHFREQDQLDSRSDITYGFNVAHGTCDDSLDQTYFLVDNTDIREIFMEVYVVYLRYFEEQGLVSTN